MEPWLTNVEATMLPRPWVKWAYEPVRAEDVPAAFMRAIATALQPPAGAVFLSHDLDAIKRAAAEAWTKSKPTVLEISIFPQVPPLM